MKLHELLALVSFKTPIAIQDVDAHVRRRGQIKFQKAGNIQLQKIRNVLDYDVMSINMSEKGLWVQVFDRDRLNREIASWDVVNKYFLRYDQRRGVK